MENTADLAMVQKTIINTSTKRISHRGSLLKGVTVQGVLYQSILNAKLTGRKKLGRKMCTMCSHLPEHFRALHASFCWQALWRWGFHFPTGLGTCPHCQRYQKLVQWPWCYCAWLTSKLTRPEPRESRWETPDPTMQMTWRPLSKQPGLHYTWAVPQTDRLHATPQWCSNSCKRRPNQVLSAYEHTFQKPDISV